MKADATAWASYDALVDSLSMEQLREALKREARIRAEAESREFAFGDVVRVNGYPWRIGTGTRERCAPTLHRLEEATG